MDYQLTYSRIVCAEGFHSCPLLLFRFEIGSKTVLGKISWMISVLEKICSQT